MKTKSYQTIARIVGALFLTATFGYSFGDSTVQSLWSMPDALLYIYPNRMQVITGVLLIFLAAAANVIIGVLLFEILTNTVRPLPSVTL